MNGRNGTPVPPIGPAKPPHVRTVYAQGLTPELGIQMNPDRDDFGWLVCKTETQGWVTLVDLKRHISWAGETKVLGRSEVEVVGLLARAAEQIPLGSTRSYERGVIDALSWVAKRSEEAPV